MRLPGSEPREKDDARLWDAVFVCVWAATGALAMVVVVLMVVGTEPGASDECTNTMHQATTTV